MTKEEQLEARISNLEHLAQCLWGLIVELQPPATQEDGHRLFVEHFNKVKELSESGKMEGKFKP